MQHSFIDKYSDIHSPIHRLDPRTKLVCLLAFVVLVVTTPNTAIAGFGLFAVMISLTLMLSKIPPLYILKRLCLIIPFVLFTAVFLPFVKRPLSDPAAALTIWGVAIDRQGLLLLRGVAIKSILAVSAMIVLTSSTTFPVLMRGMESLRVPKILIMILSFMYRYIFVIIDEAMRMQRAGTSRSAGGHRWRHIRAMSSLIGLLFIRAYERAERVYQSMGSRGFDGDIRTVNRLAFSTADLFFAVLFLGGIFAVRFWEMV
jgi:cobalt/nickel transport system permease protein